MPGGLPEDDITYHQIIMKKLFAIMAFVVAFAAVRGQGVSWGGDVVRRVSCVDNDTLSVERLAVVNPVEDAPRYQQEWLSFTNKTADTLTVTYRVQATLTRYGKRFTYDYTLTVDPRSVIGDNVYSHFHTGHFIQPDRYRDTDCRVDAVELLRLPAAKGE